MSGHYVKSVAVSSTLPTFPAEGLTTGVTCPPRPPFDVEGSGPKLVILLFRHPVYASHRLDFDDIVVHKGLKDGEW